MWSWKFLNVRFVSILPEPRALFTIISPSLTNHGAGDLSRVKTHSSRFLPSKSTMASDGGAESVAPGVTTFGSGSHTSVSLGLPLGPLRPPPGAAGGCCAIREKARTKKTIGFMESSLSRGYNAASTSRYRYFAPSLTNHGAGDLSRVKTHSSRFLPSKSTMASDGGAESVAPGVTTFGSGSHTSVSLGLPLGPLRPPPGAAGGCCAIREKARTKKTIGFMESSLSRGYNAASTSRYRYFAPSLTNHGAGDLSRVKTHSSRFLPSKSTMASDGGAESVAPGVTTFGSGSHTSVSLGLPLGPLRPPPGAAGGCCAIREKARTKKTIGFMESSLSRGYNAASTSRYRYFAPSLTNHGAGDLSRVKTHSSRFLPSKSTMASDGGAESVAPGVTTFGSGSHTSVSLGLPLGPLRPPPGAAGGCCAIREKARTKKTIGFMESSLSRGYNAASTSRYRYFAPSLTNHGAGDLSRVKTHSSRFLPSKSTMASDGGAESVAPGVTTFGSGSHTSVSLGLPLGPLRPPPGAAGGCCAIREKARTKKTIGFMESSLSRGYNAASTSRYRYFAPSTPSHGPSSYSSA